LLHVHILRLNNEVIVCVELSIYTSKNALNNPKKTL